MSQDSAHHRAFSFKPTRAEVARLRLLWRKQKLAAEERDAKRISWNDYFKRDSLLRAEVKSIAEAVGRRTIGEIPLTLRESGWTEGSLRKPVVVFEFWVHEWAGQLEWTGMGVELRKDGSVGEKRGDIRLDRNPLCRRHLDGSWGPLVPLQSC